MKNSTKYLIVALLALCLIFALAFSACELFGNDPQTPSDPSDPSDNEQSQEKPQETPADKYYSAISKEEVVKARKNTVEQTVQGYDFTLTLKGDFSVLGLGASVSGKYEGSYRYDKAKDEVKFKRTTSGALLFDSTAYVITSGDNRIKLTMKDNKIKKISVEIPEEQNITMVNLPVVALVDAIKEENIGKITPNKLTSTYAYDCSVQVDSSGIVGKALNAVLEKLGTGVSFKGIQLQASSSLQFNVADNQLNDFHFVATLAIMVNNKSVAVTLDYQQRGADGDIDIPSIANSELLYKSADIASEVAAINASLLDIENDEAYSLDLTAKNEFDPGWNKNAIVDSYIARMYKKGEWFNHSFCYKAHSEKDGKESYKFTIGNVNGEDEANQGTWIISRKSTNTQTQMENVTAQTQFELLTSFVALNANEIDCIKKVTVNNKTTYQVYLGKAGTRNVQEKILAMINSNPYDSDVIEVNNYFSDENLIRDAYIEVVVEDNKLTAIQCKTELKYTPTGGDWTEYNITLNNTITMEVNKNLAKAQKYVEPTKVKGNALGWGKNLNDSEFYIL